MLEKAREGRARGILFVPDWPGNMMTLEVRRSRKLRPRGTMRPVFECPVWFENSTFRGLPKFNMLVYEMMF